MSAPHDFAKTVLLVCAAGSGLVIATPAVAKERPVVVQADPDLRTERVSFADLDLASARGAKRLHYRVGKAVKDVCLFDNNRAKLQPTDYYSCADQSWSEARPQIAAVISRAQQLAMSGQPALAATAITVSAGRR